jgi:hypothetical protein
MGFIKQYEVPPVPTAETGSDPWCGQEHDRRAHLEFIIPTDRCFYCGKPLTCERLIYWGGSDEKGTQIWMHVACTSRLIAGLAKDVGWASE